MNIRRLSDTTLAKYEAAERDGTITPRQMRALVGHRLICDDTFVTAVCRPDKLTVEETLRVLGDGITRLAEIEKIGKEN